MVAIHFPAQFCPALVLCLSSFLTEMLARLCTLGLEAHTFPPRGTRVVSKYKNTPFEMLKAWFFPFGPLGSRHAKISCSATRLASDASKNCSQQMRLPGKMSGLPSYLQMLAYTARVHTRIIKLPAVKPKMTLGWVLNKLIPASASQYQTQYLPVCNRNLGMEAWESPLEKVSLKWKTCKNIQRGPHSVSLQFVTQYAAVVLHLAVTHQLRCKACHHLPHNSLPLVSLLTHVT